LACGRHGQQLDARTSHSEIGLTLQHATSHIAIAGDTHSDRDRGSARCHEIGSGVRFRGRSVQLRTSIRRARNLAGNTTLRDSRRTLAIGGE
jgi:hypothetical protein